MYAAKRILVVDDEDGIRRLVARLLTKAGYDVESALPLLIDQRPLPERQAARELYFRLGRGCHAALLPIALDDQLLADESRPKSPQPLPPYARPAGGHAVERTSPRR